MKKVLFLIVILIAAAGMSTGCGDTTNTTNTGTSASLIDFDKTLTLQGKVMDAVTGEALGGSDLKVYLIQGTQNRSPNKLVSDTNNALVGEYAFSGIPISFQNQTAYKVVAVKDGYQRFEAECLFDAAAASSSVIDENYNWIGNIYLYPVGEQAGDVTIYAVNPNNKPIPSATVLLTQNINSNQATANTTSGTSSIPGSSIGNTRLTATDGLIPSLSATTDSDGKAVFPGSSLTLGGQYTPTVLAMSFENEQLASTSGSNVLVGSSQPAPASTQWPALQYIQMDRVINNQELVIASTSNIADNSITSSGVLTITFNRPVELDTTTGAATFDASITGGGVLGSPAVSAALSADQLRLTLTPNITTAPTTAGAAVTYTVSGANIYIAGYPGNLFNVFSGIRMIDGSASLNAAGLNAVTMINP